VLLKLFNDQITRYWENIREMLEASAPPLVGDNPGAVNQIMENILLGKMQCWVLYEQKGDVKAPEIRIYAMLVTQIWHEPGSFTKNLLIYALYGYSFVPEELWKSGLESLKRWAKKKKCYAIVAFTQVPRVADLVKMLGGDTSTTFLKLEIDK